MRQVFVVSHQFILQCGGFESHSGQPFVLWKKCCPICLSLAASFMLRALHQCTNIHISLYTLQSLKFILTSSVVSSVVGNFQVLESDSGVFNVSCTSTGGRPLRMSVTGPSGVVEDMMNIVVEGDMEGQGNDTFSAEVVRQNGKHGDFYTCIASNEVSNTSSNSPILQGLTFYYWHMGQ